ncbi:hypothetical protein OB920_13220 [Halobacteria archaeon HArc-gm2]|nr:hypothetical protein [Halobacteria archaeon HArc-gm2]
MVEITETEKEIMDSSDDELLTAMYEAPEDNLYAVIEYLRRQNNPDRHVLNELKNIHYSLRENGEPFLGETDVKNLKHHLQRKVVVKSLAGSPLVTSHTDDETENPWSYLDDYALTGKPESIKAADRHRDELIDELDRMVSSGQVATTARLVSFAKDINRERTDVDSR